MPTPTEQQGDAWFDGLRLAPFRETTTTWPAAFELYAWDSRVATAMFEVIAQTEVLVRNAIHHRMKRGRPTNELTSWLLDDRVLRPKQIEAVQDALARLRRSSRPVTEDRVIAGLYFSFWSGLLAKRHYEQLWRHTLASAFPQAPDLRYVASRVNRLVQLRNRIAHHQHLLDVDLPAHVGFATDLAAAIDPAAGVWLRGLSRVDDVLSQRP